MTFSFAAIDYHHDIRSVNVLIGSAMFILADSGLVEPSMYGLLDALIGLRPCFETTSLLRPQVALAVISVYQLSAAPRSHVFIIDKSYLERHH